MITTFWYLAGFLSGVAAALLVAPLYRAAPEALARPKVRYAVLATFATAFAVSGILLYLKFGSPQLLDGRARTSPSVSRPGSASGARSMDVEIANLESRLNRNGGSADDWELLARSYEFLGRPEDAQRARDKGKGVGSLPTGAAMAAVIPKLAAPAATSSTPDVSPDELERRTRANPRDVDTWLDLAAARRKLHDYPQARDAYRKVISLKGMTADAWADYADVSASLSGGQLGSESARAIDSALALDSSNPKALWLKASQALQDRHYADALSLWKRLRSVLPADSSDARIVDSNIAEASQLAGMPAASAEVAKQATQGPNTQATPAQATPAEVSGTVSIDSKLASKVAAGATLFVYAKAADSPGPPLAVMRTSAGSWPVSFRLDDTMAMMPMRKLSQFDKVVIEARVSRSGQASPETGDLYVTSAVLQPSARKKLALVINKEIG